MHHTMFVKALRQKTSSLAEFQQSKSETYYQNNSSEKAVIAIRC